MTQGQYMVMMVIELGILAAQSIVTLAWLGIAWHAARSLRKMAGK